MAKKKKKSETELVMKKAEKERLSKSCTGSNSVKAAEGWCRMKAESFL